MRKVLFTTILVLYSSSALIADSEDNVFRSISILAAIGENQTSLPISGSLSNAQFSHMYNQYQLAYKIGNNYKSKEIKKKLGRKFLREWKKNIKALKVIVQLYGKLDSQGGNFSQREIKNLADALSDIENFRLFYVQWRNS